MRGVALTPLRASLAIAFSMTLATFAAFLRTPPARGLAPGPQLLAGYPALIFGLAMLLAASAYLRGLATASGALSSSHLLAAVLIQLCALPSPPLTSTDAMMNLAYGRLAVLGLNPYTTPPRALPEADSFRSHLDWPDSLNAWGPVALYAAALAAQTDDQARALVAFKLMMFGAVLLSLLAAFRYARSLPAGEGSRAFFFFASNPLLAWELSGQAHNDALLVLCGVVFVWVARAPARVRPFLWLCAGVLTKYGLAPTLGLYGLLLRRESRPRFALATGLGVVLCAAVWLPFFAGVASFQGLRTAALPAPSRIVNSVSSFAALAELLTGAPIFRLWSAAASGVMVTLAVRYARRAHTLACVLSDSLSFTLLYQLLAMPCYWPWYATWLLPLALAQDNRRQRLTIAAFTSLAPALYMTGVAGGVAILVVHPLALGLWLAARRAPR